MGIFCTMIATSVNLHGLTLMFRTTDAPLADRFRQVYGHLPPGEPEQTDILIAWERTDRPAAPPPPPGTPLVSAGELVSYYGLDDLIMVRLPKYGLITVDMRQNQLSGVVTAACLEAYGVFEDILLICLAPLYRRRGWFPLHAFAGQGPDQHVALVSGPMGSGKTTTGLALLCAGWKLLSNDSPLLTIRNERVYGLAYPGQLSAFDDSLARFEQLARFIPPSASRPGQARPPERQKRVFRAEEAFTEPWVTSGPIGGVFFPQVVTGLKHSELVRLVPTEAILQLMPQGIEGWDKAAIGHSLRLLSKLVEQAPSYLLRLSPQVETLPALLAQGMTN
jgi:hypothetical protein